MLVPTNRRSGLFHRPERENLLYLHVPKCGGSFVEQAFLPWIRKCPSRRYRDTRGHLTYVEYRTAFRRHGINIDDMTILTAVRNPWDWHVSWFHYLKEDVDKHRSGMPTEVQLFQKYDFKDYLHWLSYDTAPTSPSGYIRKQLVDFLIDESGSMKVDHILRQERLEEDLVQLKEALDLDIEIPTARINASRHGDYRQFYDDAGVDLVARRHAQDIARFGYSFDPPPGP